MGGFLLFQTIDNGTGTRVVEVAGSQGSEATLSCELIPRGNKEKKPRPNLIARDYWLLATDYYSERQVISSFIASTDERPISLTEI